MNEIYLNQNNNNNNNKTTSKAQEATSEPLYDTSIQPLIQTKIQRSILKLLNSCSNIGWIIEWIKDHLNWSYRSFTTTINMLLED